MLSSGRNAVLSFALVLGACATGSDTASSPTSTPAESDQTASADSGDAGDAATSSSTTSEAPKSVRPGANDRFLAAEDMADFIESFEAEKREVAAHRADIVAALAIQPGEVVADVGSGTGLFVSALSEAVGPKGRVVATELSPPFLEHLREKTKGIDNVELRAAEALDAKLDAASVDLIFLCDVYHHIEYPPQYLATLERALRPGGRLVIVDFERIEGTTSEAMMKHVRAGKEVVIEEVGSAGFKFDLQVEIEGLSENYFIRFTLVRAD